jgi:hypothetical protein
MEFYTHDGTYLISSGYSNILPEPEEGEYLVEGKPEGLTSRPPSDVPLRFNIHTMVWEDTRPDEKKRADAEYQARRTRDSLLAKSDWTQLPDVSVSARDAWTEYRQALRDVPEQAGFPEEIIWPTAPG